MKAPVGLLSDRTVLRSKMEGPRPDKFRFSVKLERVVNGCRPAKSCIKSGFMALQTNSRNFPPQKKQL